MKLKSIFNNVLTFRQKYWKTPDQKKANLIMPDPETRENLKELAKLFTVVAGMGISWFVNHHKDQWLVDAAANGHVALLQPLHEIGAKTYASMEDIRGNTVSICYPAMDAAVENGQFDSAMKLLEFVAEKSRPLLADEMFETTLRSAFQAASPEYLDFATKLAKLYHPRQHTLDCFVTGSSIMGSVYEVKLLLDWGADPNNHCYTRTPLEFAQERRHPEVADLLKSRGAQEVYTVKPLF